MWKSITKGLRKIKDFKENSLNARHNRQLVGNDRSGNKYYQYYESDGAESRRFVEPGPNTQPG